MNAIRQFVTRSAAALVAVGSILGSTACSDVASPTGPTRAPAVARALPIMTAQDSLNANLITPEQFKLGLLSLLDAVKPCLKNGYTQYTTTKGVAFKNVLECALYAGFGGKLVAIAPPPPAGPVISSFTYDGTLDLCSAGHGFNAQFTAQFTGGTGTITPPAGGATVAVTSGQQVPIPIVTPGDYTLTVTGAGGSVASVLQPFGAGSGPVAGCPDNSGGFNIIPVNTRKIVP